MEEEKEEEEEEEEEEICKSYIISPAGAFPLISWGSSLISWVLLGVVLWASRFHRGGYWFI